MALEKNYEEWKEIRSRVDSIANAIFLISGGALSISISVMLSNKAAGLVTPLVASTASRGWYLLASSIVLMLVLKTNLIFQAFMLQFKTNVVNRYLRVFNAVSWAIGLSGLLLFVWGIWLLVTAATGIMNV